MLPRAEIGSSIYWSSGAVSTPVPLGTMVVVERGSAAVFFGELVDWRSPNEIRVRVSKYFYKDQTIFTYQGAKWFDKTSRTNVYLWNQSGVSGSAQPSPPPDPKQKARDARKAAATNTVRSRREQRKAYVAHRDILKNVRDELQASLAILSINSQVSREEFKQVRRAFMLEWHPDKETFFVNEGGDVSEFRTRSGEIVQALSFVDHFINKRDSVS